MALWTDPSRQYLISSIRNRPVIWDKSYTGESNYRSMKIASFRDVTDEMNGLFPMPVKFTTEDVRSQWKNLKDTFVRKLRWVHAGKYVEDPIKEPTWKFYRMLSFLDDKEAKRLGDETHTYELQPATGNGAIQNCHSLKSERQSMHPSNSSMMPPISYEPTSSEEQMLQMFSQQPVHQQGIIDAQMAPCSSNSNKNVYSPPSQNGSSSGVEEEDEEEQPERKKRFRRQAPPMQQMQVIHSPSVNGQDEFDHFGAFVAANLRRKFAERGRQGVTCLQRKLSDVLFSED